MHMTRRAPELSATSRLVCIWIMVPSSLGCLRASHDLLLLLALDHLPALELRERPAFLDPDDIAHRELVLLVMGVIFLRASNSLLHDRMGEAALDAHNHRLVLLVAHDDAMQRALGHLASPSSWTWRAPRASAWLWPQPAARPSAPAPTAR